MDSYLPKVYKALWQQPTIQGQGPGMGHLGPWHLEPCVVWQDSLNVEWKRDLENCHRSSEGVLCWGGGWGRKRQESIWAPESWR